MQELSEKDTCRALNENKPKVKLEFSANGTGALRENKPEAKFEVSATGSLCM